MTKEELRKAPSIQVQAHPGTVGTQRPAPSCLCLFQMQNDQILNQKNTMNQLQLRTDLKSMEEQFAMALPEHIKPSHVQRVVMTEVQKNPKILDCTKDSILRAVTEACQWV